MFFICRSLSLLFFKMVMQFEQTESNRFFIFIRCSRLHPDRDFVAWLQPLEHVGNGRHLLCHSFSPTHVFAQTLTAFAKRMGCGGNYRGRAYRRLSGKLQAAMECLGLFRPPLSVYGANLPWVFADVAGTLLSTHAFVPQLFQSFWALAEAHATSRFARLIRLPYGTNWAAFIRIPFFVSCSMSWVSVTVAKISWFSPTTEMK